MPEISPIFGEHFGYVLTPDERYIIAFGGSQNSEYYDDIYIWDLKMMIFKRSEQKCPEINEYRACIMVDKMVDDVVVYGYMRRYIDSDMRHLPQDIIAIMLQWCQDSFVHLIAGFSAINGDFNKHWKIQLSKLL